MYCPSCNSYNDDNSRFCSNCGAPLQRPQPEQPAAGAYEAPPQQGSYTPPQSDYGYQQPYHQTYQPTYPADAEPTKPITIATPVVAIILNIVFFNVIGLVLAVLSLVNYNNYTNEKNRGGFELAETYKRKAKTFATIADVLAIVWIVLLAALVVAAIVFGLVSVSGNGGVVDFNYYGGDFPSDIFGMIG